MHSSRYGSDELWRRLGDLSPCAILLHPFCGVEWWSHGVQYRVHANSILAFHCPGHGDELHPAFFAGISHALTSVVGDRLELWPWGDPAGNLPSRGFAGCCCLDETEPGRARISCPSPGGYADCDGCTRGGKGQEEDHCRGWCDWQGRLRCCETGRKEKLITAAPLSTSVAYLQLAKACGM